ncbi:hypothetical protein M5K25_009832 [Dendrobium thyrsiflorum]|uniref:Uncharacterized protein n=1 Tax=Dendrobium thyrsiflorum TaxID=117978 RepID=A0ABD0V763_DENTH
MNSGRVDIRGFKRLRECCERRRETKMIAGSSVAWKKQNELHFDCILLTQIRLELEASNELLTLTPFADRDTVAAVGFSADNRDGVLQASDVVTRTLGACIYPKSPAVYLGLFSAVAVAIDQAVINFVSGVTFVIAFLLLLIGSTLNDQKGMQKIYLGVYYYVLKHEVFSGGAIVSLSSVALRIIYYLALQKPKSSQPWDPPLNHGIALGQPHIPPRIENPIFMHEDTYNRQQVS